MEFLNKLIFAVYPYIALTVFLVGCWIRYDHEQYTWKTDSTQLLSTANMVLASNFFHIGILAIFAGHFAGLVLPMAFGWLRRIGYTAPVAGDFRRNGVRHHVSDRRRHPVAAPHVQSSGAGGQPLLRTSSSFRG